MKKMFVLLGLILLVFSACESTQNTTGEQPVAAMTSKDPLITENLQSPRGYLARPNDEKSYPGVVMIHEWWGLNEHIKAKARELASEGYVVLAVDLYGEETNNASRARELSSGVRANNSAAIEQMKQAVLYLRNHGSNQIGSLGWCFGGQQSLQLSLNEPLDATVIYYGNLVNDTALLSSIKKPVLGIFGSNDTSISVQSVAAFESSLDALNISNEIYMYPGVGHAFANPSNPNFAPNETIDAWQKTLAFLDGNLK